MNAPLLILVAGHSGMRRAVRVGGYPSRWGLIRQRPVVRSTIREVRWWRRWWAARGGKLLHPQECAELIVWRRATALGPWQVPEHLGPMQAAASAGQATSEAA